MKKKKKSPQKRQSHKEAPKNTKFKTASSVVSRDARYFINHANEQGASSDNLVSHGVNLWQRFVYDIKQSNPGALTDTWYKLSFELLPVFISTKPIFEKFGFVDVLTVISWCSRMTEKKYVIQNQMQPENMREYIYSLIGLCEVTQQQMPVKAINRCLQVVYKGMQVRNADTTNVLELSAELISMGSHSSQQLNLGLLADIANKAHKVDNQDPNTLLRSVSLYAKEPWLPVPSNIGEQIFLGLSKVKNFNLLLSHEVANFLLLLPKFNSLSNLEQVMVILEGIKKNKNAVEKIAGETINEFASWWLAYSSSKIAENENARRKYFSEVTSIVLLYCEAGGIGLNGSLALKFIELILALSFKEQLGCMTIRVLTLNLTKQGEISLPLIHHCYDNGLLMHCKPGKKLVEPVLRSFIDLNVPENKQSKMFEILFRMLNNCEECPDFNLIHAFFELIKTGVYSLNSVQLPHLHTCINWWLRYTHYYARHHDCKNDSKMLLCFYVITEAALTNKLPMERDRANTFLKSFLSHCGGCEKNQYLIHQSCIQMRSLFDDTTLEGELVSDLFETLLPVKDAELILLLLSFADLVEIRSIRASAINKVLKHVVELDLGVRLMLIESELLLRMVELSSATLHSDHINSLLSDVLKAERSMLWWLTKAPSVLFDASKNKDTYALNPTIANDFGKKLLSCLTCDDDIELADNDCVIGLEQYFSAVRSCKMYSLSSGVIEQLLYHLLQMVEADKASCHLIPYCMAQVAGKIDYHSSQFFNMALSIYLKAISSEGIDECKNLVNILSWMPHIDNSEVDSHRVACVLGAFFNQEYILHDTRLVSGMLSKFRTCANQTLLDLLLVAETAFVENVSISSGENVVADACEYFLMQNKHSQLNQVYHKWKRVNQPGLRLASYYLRSLALGVAYRNVLRAFDPFVNASWVQIGFFSSHILMALAKCYEKQRYWAAAANILTKLEDMTRSKPLVYPEVLVNLALLSKGIYVKDLPLAVNAIESYKSQPHLRHMSEKIKRALKTLENRQIQEVWNLCVKPNVPQNLIIEECTAVKALCERLMTDKAIDILLTLINTKKDNELGAATMSQVLKLKNAQSRMNCTRPLILILLSRHESNVLSDSCNNIRWDINACIKNISCIPTKRKLNRARQVFEGKVMNDREQRINEYLMHKDYEAVRNIFYHLEPLCFDVFNESAKQLLLTLSEVHILRRRKNLARDVLAKMLPKLKKSNVMYKPALIMFAYVSPQEAFALDPMVSEKLEGYLKASVDHQQTAEIKKARMQLRWFKVKQFFTSPFRWMEICLGRSSSERQQSNA